MERLLAISTALNLVGTGVSQNGRLIAFSIIELLDNGYAMGHFAKCDADSTGFPTSFIRPPPAQCPTAAVDI